MINLARHRSRHETFARSTVIKLDFDRPAIRPNDPSAALARMLERGIHLCIGIEFRVVTRLAVCCRFSVTALMMRSSGIDQASKPGFWLRHAFDHSFDVYQKKAIKWHLIDFLIYVSAAGYAVGVGDDNLRAALIPSSTIRLNPSRRSATELEVLDERGLIGIEGVEYPLEQSGQMAQGIAQGQDVGRQTSCLPNLASPPLRTPSSGGYPMRPSQNRAPYPTHRTRRPVLAHVRLLTPRRLNTVPVAKDHGYDHATGQTRAVNPFKTASKKTACINRRGPGPLLASPENAQSRTPISDDRTL